MALESLTHPNPIQTLDQAYTFYHKRGWEIKEIPQKTEDGSATAAETIALLVPTDKGAALECGDGRADKLENRKLHGPRVFGQVNALTATLTGGDQDGFFAASTILHQIGYAPGTHSDDAHGCGFYELWKAGKLSTGVFPCEIEERLATRPGIKLGHRLSELMEAMGGKHFRYRDNHQEQGLRINFEDHTTEKPQNGERFRVDDWLLRMAGMPPRQRFLQYAETVEQLKPDAVRVEFILPKVA